MDRLFSPTFNHTLTLYDFSIGIIMELPYKVLRNNGYCGDVRT